MIILKKLSINKHVTTKYLKWLNDIDVTKYTEQRHYKNTLKKIKNFINEKNKSSNDYLFGIFFKQGKLLNHIGNIILARINHIHKTADVTYIIGEKKYWSRGFASKAVKKIELFAKKKNIKKLNAELYSCNKASEKVLKKCGFRIEGIIKSAVIFKNKRYSKYIYGKII